MYAVADRILWRTVVGEPIRRKLIALRVEEQDALRRRFERAKSEGDLPNDADAADLARLITAPIRV